MYVTRPLSLYKKFPSALSLPPPEGPNSGILVILDEETEPTCCFGLCKSNELRELPFPQNKDLRTYYTTNSGAGQQSQTQYHYTRVVFIPVLDQPLSSNQYYAIQPRGRHKGEAFTSSTEEDMTTCCFCYFVNDRKPQPFDPNNIYQQIEVCNYKRRGFSAKSVLMPLSALAFQISTACHYHPRLLDLSLWENGTVLSSLSKKVQYP
ncbi:hypothetical protein CUMW_101110 [Citrus unshiu]|nr:hypothetical protein CUMW_101110 [Citrus unshiu]